MEDEEKGEVLYVIISKKNKENWKRIRETTMAVPSVWLKARYRTILMSVFFKFIVCIEMRNWVYS